eukprot:CAMPEP_0179725644 /NCGR_PEP_ID=MMETSP0938-20121108/6656_1 /TAXON_ID=548131 ORGANISM="Ostreococcus mediterraneus, Strain clade-D-RCC1107" /NCGR_SAMPLE_ID=MMETSP0938 /ASSEMBLY_ACC=CAM_ASM_000576 /LENGTH=93 /DNA_ID=CAMNT_0021599735 /DNA_START=76 /DNA_END=354 /DNA_ORIENTATION=+
MATPSPPPRRSSNTVKSLKYASSTGGANVVNFRLVSALKLTPTVATTSPFKTPTKYVPNGNAPMAPAKYTSNVRRSVGNPLMPLPSNNAATSG